MASSSSPSNNEGDKDGNRPDDNFSEGNSSSKSLLACPEDSKLEGDKPRYLDDVLSGLKLGRFHWLMLALVGGGYFAVCSEMMLFIFLSEPIKKEWNLADLQFPWLPFSTGITGIIGGFVCGTISDKFGRQIPFLCGILVIAVFGIVSAFAPSYPVFIVFRCMVTLGTGAFEAVGFVLLLEFLPKQHRGTVLVVVTLCGALGALFVGVLAWLLLPHVTWRWFVGACAAPAVLMLLYQPIAFYESPRYLFISGQREKGIKVLKAIARINKSDICSFDNVVCTPSSEKSSRQKRGYMMRLFSKELRGRTLVFSLIWFLQATGYWGITIYLPEYMSNLGADPYFNMFSVFIGEIPGLLLAMILIEKYMLGRIRCLRFFSAVTAASLLVFSFIPQHALKSVLIIICYFSMVPIYSILNTFTPEVYPTDVRSTAMAWMNIVIEIPGLVTPFVGATLLSSNLPWLYPLVWGLVFVIQCVVTFALSIETAGKDLRDFHSQLKVAEKDPSTPPVEQSLNCEC